MASFLSDDWVRELDRAAAGSETLRRAARGRRLVLQQIVSDAPRGAARYYVEVDDGVVAARSGEAAAPDVCLHADYETAVAISRGTDSAQGAFLKGRLRIEGDVTALLRNGDLFTELDDVFAGVRARTTY